MHYAKLWYGWLRGRHPVPEDGQRMPVERLRGLRRIGACLLLGLEQLV